jgi:hypothetical protein
MALSIVRKSKQITFLKYGVLRMSSLPALVITDVSEERITSMIKAEKSAKQEQR